MPTNLVECPFCKEDIKEGAIKCKHCSSMLADFPSGLPFSPPPAPDDAGESTLGVAQASVAVAPPPPGSVTDCSEDRGHLRSSVLGMTIGGMVLCATGIGALLGLPLLLMAAHTAFKVQGLKGACPSCGRTLRTLSNVPKFRCPHLTCRQVIHVKPPFFMTDPALFEAAKLHGAIERPREDQVATPPFVAQEPLPPIDWERLKDAVKQPRIGIPLVLAIAFVVFAIETFKPLIMIVVWASVLGLLSTGLPNVHAKFPRLRRQTGAAFAACFGLALLGGLTGRLKAEPAAQPPATASSAEAVQANAPAAEEVLPPYEVADRQVYDAPIKSQVEIRLIVPKDVTTSALRRILEREYQSAMSSGPYKHHAKLTHVFIFAHVSKKILADDPGRWLGRLMYLEHEGSEPKIDFNDDARITLAESLKRGEAELARKRAEARAKVSQENYFIKFSKFRVQGRMLDCELSSNFPDGSELNFEVSRVFYQDGKPEKYAGALYDQDIMLSDGRYSIETALDDGVWYDRHMEQLAEMPSIFSPPQRIAREVEVRVLLTPRAQSEAVLRVIGQDGEKIQGAGARPAFDFTTYELTRTIALPFNGRN